MPPAVLLSANPPCPSEDLREWLAGAGFAVQPHPIGAAFGVEFAALAAAVVEVGPRPDAAAAQTRRWRAELGDDLLPIIWVLPNEDSALAALGLDAGADVVLVRPLVRVAFVAQVRAAERARGSANRVAARAGESRLLGEQLTRARAQFDREVRASRRIHLALQQRPFPELVAARFHVCHRPRGCTGDFHAVHALDADRVLFLVGDVIGPAPATSLLATFLAQSATADDLRDPGAVLSRANRELLRVAGDDAPLVAMCVGVLHPHTGELRLARAGLPAPVHLPAEDTARVLAVPGPFLGTAETTYPTHSTHLKPGDRLLLGTDGTRPNGDPGPETDSHLAEVALRHRELNGQRFVDAVAAELLAQVRHEEDFTLLSVEFRAG
jgi:sigma-B regulation protein RsbU (phosphoserine phosphatase)